MIDSLKSLMPLYKSLMFLILLLVSSSSILALRYAFFLFLKCLLASRLTWFRLSTLLWLGSCTHCILARVLRSKKPKHSSSNQGLCCCNLCRPRLSFAEVLIFSLMFSQVLFTSLSSFKWSRGIAVLIVTLGHRWKWVINVIPQLLYTQERYPLYPQQLEVNFFQV